ncbi:Duf421 protein [Romboutsia ilealis]|uniref:Duf421 protein n=1 Tax=Romboutsia ilealis TaxID=1115758 RepID=A0A1V1I0D2_9FIRM|nr:DUF421 domain-containing protein [Romboutsia ilealis]CED93676.1 Duf421 protein [Romboutsia ilealis]
MLVVLIRSIILYIAVLIALRVMGKGEIAEMNAFDLVITLLIAEVAAIPMQNNAIPIIYGISSITGLVFIEVLISYITLKSRTVSKILSGSPAVLISKNKLNYRQLKKERITIEELLEELRSQGYFNLKEVQYAILETDGDLSIVPSTSYDPNKTNDFKHLPLPVIIDGKVIKDNLNEINKDDRWILKILKSNHIKRIKDVLICIVDENDEVLIQRKKD